MTISDWIHESEIRGTTSFSADEVKSAFSGRAWNGIKVELSRLAAKGRIQAVHRGFYVIVPVQYQLKGVIPPSYYLDDLMRSIKKPYYVGLLSAAALHGASHQRSMQMQVVTLDPRIRESRKDGGLNWIYRRVLPEAFIMEKNAEVGILRYSSPELTAVDLVQFANHAGGYQRVATVLEELVDSLDVEKISELVQFTTVATLQRLGYLLEFVLDRRELADRVFAVLKGLPYRNSILLSNGHARRQSAPANRWRVNGNIDIELDDL
jgi:predicted transcriptional regulator of viral defense system